MSKRSAMRGLLLALSLIIPTVSVLADSTFVLLYQKDGAEAGDGFGWSVAGAGDVDGDAVGDFIIGAPYVAPFGISGMGSAYVYSGATGSFLLQKNGSSSDAHLGWSMAETDDVNGDGKADFIVGVPDDLFGRAYVYSSSSFFPFPLYAKHGVDFGDAFGYAVAGMGDLNRDGTVDFIVGAYSASPGGHVQAGSAYVYSGANGSLLYQKDGSTDEEWLGYSVAGAGDVNQDGIPDYIIGAPHASPAGHRSAGSAYVYSGAIAKQLLFKKDGAADGVQLGYSVAGAGDVNGDGKADFIVGAPSSSPGGRLYAGSAYVYSGAPGLPLYQMDGDSSYDLFGSSVAGVGDMDGDGKADFIIGAFNASRNGNNYAGSVYLYSGATGALLFQKEGAASGDYFGLSVAGAGDVNGDGRPDIIVGAPSASPGELTGAGSVYIYGRACAAKGDMNADSSLTAVDVMLMLDCVFLQEGICSSCFADVNCDGTLAPADVVLELLAMVANLRFPC